ncbi:DarT ssDNA thymidine ADP-ribosyltransferase family protein [Aggregatibacter sp. Marseille-P9115]|jgi:hypothetical protein|uniref:DarT ssDNA thymidine ADP-ribosyltransferase family protein n=1 Tax=Aggregatibacter sp. Marseille-P9115 TaxID=2866570 RepID=UPI001E36844A|nr:DarT ssDNA thymidine ADP-ribosyltransferase family protein [Aggregatibacter sp. Marseille-P9115]
MAIKDILQRRGIKHLCHFTQLDNLDSILIHGLIPRVDLYNAEFNSNPSLSIHGVFNDRFRLDGKPEAICLSISFPNSSMFYGLRCSNSSVKWAVIVLNAQVLIDKDCAFYPTNAANSNVNSIPISNFQGEEALEQLFKTNGNRQNLLEKDPTDVQAEVLVFDTIESDYILGAVLMSDEDVNYFKEKFSKLTFFKHRYWDVFSDRYCARKNGFEGY